MCDTLVFQRQNYIHLHFISTSDLGLTWALLFLSWLWFGAQGPGYNTHRIRGWCPLGRMSLKWCLKKWSCIILHIHIYINMCICIFLCNNHIICTSRCESHVVSNQFQQISTDCTLEIPCPSCSSQSLAFLSSIWNGPCISRNLSHIMKFNSPELLPFTPRSLIDQ